jgi:valyl-tRNA synthetase
MSKSLGNGIDPIDIINQYGADAMRYSLVLLTAEGQDVKLAPTRFEMGRNFANKLWNASRFALMNLEDAKDFRPLQHSDLAFEDRWILHELSKTTAEITEALDGFHFHAAGQIVYHFAWHSLCDWYLEAIKPRLYGARPEDKHIAQQVLATALDGLLRILHPFVPFITEELWSHLGGLVPKRGIAELRDAEALLVRAEWPKPEWYPSDDEAAASMPLVTDLVRAVRNIRSKLGLGERSEVDLVVTGANAAGLETVRRYEYFIKDLGKVKTLEAAPDLAKPHPASSEVVAGLDVFVPLRGLIDLGEERTRLEARIKKTETGLAAIEAKLSNPNFAGRAPADVVSRERARRDEVLAEVEKLRANLADLAE